jgi:hypothetical protein
MPRPCVVCTHPDRQAIESLIVSGASDYEVGRRFDIERVSVGRHRRRHLIKPAQDRLAILARDSEARREREQLAVAAAASSPSLDDFIQATVGMRTQLAKLANIEHRLERMAALAESSQSAAGVAVLAGQQIRSLEFGSKLGGTGGFAPVRGTETMPPGTKFEVNIHFNSTGTTETIATVVGNSHTIDVQQESDACENAGVMGTDTMPNTSPRQDIQEIDEC